MSKHSAAEYLSRIDDDGSFREKIILAKDNPARMKLARKAGYDFTSEELKQAFQERIGKGIKGRKKLTDEELAMVSGG
jgi:predicted ribosomally synthesized peptide with nif11-like leader